MAAGGQPPITRPRRKPRWVGAPRKDAPRESARRREEGASVRDSLLFPRYVIEEEGRRTEQ